jgi:enoyl-CoA hydratase
MENMVIVEKIGRATLLRINRSKKRNAIDYDTAIELGKAVDNFESDKSVDVLIINGDSKAFCSGADLTDTERLSGRVLSDDGPLGFTRKMVSKPVIAAISGYCVAGGMEAALWADIRVADTTAVFGFLERRYGVPLIDGGTQRLPRVIGLGRALDMIITGKTIDAKEALEIGLINYLTPSGKSLEKALEIAAIISSYPQETMKNDRLATYSGIGMPLNEGLLMEARFGKETIDKHGMDSISKFPGNRKGQ